MHQIEGGPLGPLLELLRSLGLFVTGQLGVQKLQEVDGKA